MAGIVAQVYLAGLGLFAGSEHFELHRTFGWMLHLGPILVLIAAPFARAGRAQILQAAGLAVLIFFVPIFAAVRADFPIAGALHPVAAVLGFTLAVFVALGATRLVRSTDEEPTTVRMWAVAVVVAVILAFLSMGGPTTP